ncbi:MAG: ABC transporter ATP-binding protein [Planctomycetota bacterium]|jgi:ABC-2 type transport system ATP-binding protein
MIKAHGLSKQFGRFSAVDSVEFEIPRGAVVGFLGPNGAGKTTTIRMICGYLRPSSGRALIDGIDVARHRRRVQQRLGYLPESAPLYTEMRAEEYLAFRGRLLGLGRAERRRAVGLAIDRCRIDDVRRRPIGQLSKGYRQRVGLAAALLHEPPVLILDEPTAGLDPAQMRVVRGLVRELAGRHTILLSTHNLAEVELSCDSIIMLARGRVRAAGTIDALRAAAAGDARYIVECDAGDAPEVLAGLAGVGDVEGTKLDGGWLRVTVRGRNDAGDLREAIAGAITGRGGALRELRREAPTLERLFVRLVDEAEVTPPRADQEGAEA